jgi:glucose-like phosphotransferase system IIB component
MHVLDICIGTTFSCGFIDFTLYGLLQGNAKTNWLRIIPVFMLYAVAYYFIFKFFITKFNLATPGREEEEGDIKLYTRADYNKKNKAGEKNVVEANEDSISAMILKGVGGEKNLVDIDACATRLRLTVVDSSVVDDQILKATGAKGIIKKGTGVQIIYGPQVSIIKSDFEEYVKALSNLS